MTFGQFELFYLGIDHFNFRGEGFFFPYKPENFIRNKIQIIIFFASFGKDKDIFYSKI